MPKNRRLKGLIIHHVYKLKILWQFYKDTCDAFLCVVTSCFASLLRQTRVFLPVRLPSAKKKFWNEVEAHFCIWQKANCGLLKMTNLPDWISARVIPFSGRRGLEYLWHTLFSNRLRVNIRCLTIMKSLLPRRPCPWLLIWEEWSIFQKITMFENHWKKSYFSTLRAKRAKFFLNCVKSAI